MYTRPFSHARYFCLSKSHLRVGVSFPQGASKRRRLVGTRTSAFAGSCIACSEGWLCSACLQCAQCDKCTATSRCGSCRNIHSRVHRAAGLQSSSARGSVSSKPRGALLAAVDSLDLPRTCEGLNNSYHLIASTTSAFWCVLAPCLRFAPFTAPRTYSAPTHTRARHQRTQGLGRRSLDL